MAASAPPRPAHGRPAAPGRLATLLGDPRRVLLVAAVLCSLAACVDVLHDPDLFWHLRLGRWILDNHAVPHAELFSYTAQGNAMTAHEWLSEVVFSPLNSVGGLLLVALVFGLVGWSAVVALALRTRARGVGPVATAIAVLLGARAFEPVFGTRPQVVTAACLCWSLLVCERHLARGGRLVWVLPPTALLWANMHAGFLPGLGILAGFTALEALRRGLRRPGAASWQRIGVLAAALLVAAAAACLNPRGPGLYAYVLRTTVSIGNLPITEWHAPDFADPANLGLLALLVSFAVLLLLGGRINLRDLALSAFGFAAALLAVRNTALAVVLGVPAWGAMLQQVVDRRGARRTAAAARAPASARRRGAVPRQAVALGGIVLAVALAVDGVVVARAARDAGDAAVAQVYPACTARELQGVSGVRIFAPYYHSGYLVLRLWPQGRVFLYGEAASFGQGVFDEYERILGGGAPALALLRDTGTDAVLIGPGALRTTLLADGGWRRVLDDPMGATLYATPGLAARLARAARLLASGDGPCRPSDGTGASSAAAARRATAGAAPPGGRRRRSAPPPPPRARR